MPQRAGALGTQQTGACRAQPQAAPAQRPSCAPWRRCSCRSSAWTNATAESALLTSADAKRWHVNHGDLAGLVNPRVLNDVLNKY